MSTNQLKKKYYLPLLREQGEEIKENGYSFDRLKKSTSLFWEFVFGYMPRFNKEHVRVVHRAAIDDLLKRTRGELEELYPFFPPSVQELYSLEEALALYEHSREFAIISRLERKSTILGFYEPRRDRCYIAREGKRGHHYSVRELASVAVHELTHREVHQQRSRKPEFVGRVLLNDHWLEEDFCRGVQASYEELLFSRDGDSVDFDEIATLPLDLQKVTGLPQARRYTRQRIQYYKGMLFGRD